MDEIKYEICRTCLSKTNVPILLFGKDKLFKALRKSVPNVMIDKDDGYPQIICSNCSTDISKIINFQNKCEESDKHFRKSKPLNNEAVLQVKCEATEYIKTEINYDVNFIKDESNIEKNDCLGKVLKDVRRNVNAKMKGDEMQQQLSTEKVRQNTMKQNLASTNLKKNTKVETFKKSKRHGKINIIVMPNNDKYLNNFKDCPNCRIQFQTLDSLEEHQRIHGCYIPNCCKLCGTEYDRPSGLKRHYESLVHINKLKLEDRKKVMKKPQEEHSCKMCNKKFTRKFRLKEHEKMHDPNAEHFECDFCSKIYFDKRKFIVHMQRHLSNRELVDVCPICGTGFTNRASLVKHLERHSEVPQFECKQCGKKLYREAELNKHVTVIHGEKKFLCNTCGKAFARKGELKSHTRFHTGDRPFSCKYCGKAFHCSSAVLVHERIHTGVKPYSCRICGKKFPRTSAWRKHERVMHRDVK